MNIAELKNRSYTPYSKAPAVAVVQSREGAFFPGVRIENISFPLTIAAAQNALFCCLSEGHHPEKIFLDQSLENNPRLWDGMPESECERADLESFHGDSFQPVVQQLSADQMNRKLQLLLDNPFVEYSNFPVSALIETADGYISGINIERGDWSRGLCAERVALAKALSYGKTDLKALHITTRHGEYNSPCGACRQVILEHLPHHPVYLHYADGSHARLYSSDLLPYSFQSTTLQQKNKS